MKGEYSKFSFLNFSFFFKIQAHAVLSIEQVKVVSHSG